ncbi:MAG TPA: hypothetical protein VE685_11265 [Thermoanaerobaculia bacterium]|nr:hypothetical protein [Thermoanaerobaculia bacterium]
MKTVVDLKDEHRAKLLKLAAHRGEEDISGILADALEAYLAQFQQPDEERVKAALKLEGALSDEEAEEMRRAVEELRASRPVPDSRLPRPSGLCAGEFSVPDDFDDSLPEDVLSSFEEP